jgi:hypothetical protein
LILQPFRVIESLETLVKRIQERFGDVGLAEVCAQLCQLARTDTKRARKISRGYFWVRFLVFLLLVAAVALFAFVVSVIDLSSTPTAGQSESVSSILQGIEAAANLTLLTGAAIIFLIKLEERLKRSSALAALHELRSIVHVIDMDQLTKDPSKFIVSRNTASSPPLTLNEFEMTRYLEYCSEMLSLTSKVAVLFGQSLEDQVVGEVVSDIEHISTGLSAKIWQKISMLQELRATDQSKGAHSVKAAS